MNENTRFGVIFSEFAPRHTDIYDFEDETWYASGYGYGETARDAIIDACKSYCDGRQLWDITTHPAGYLVEFDENGNVENVERQTLHVIGELTYTVEFDEGDKKTFFKASN